MSRTQEWLARVAEELGVRIAMGYVAVLSDGTRLPSQGLFPDFGGVFGTLVFDSADVIDAAARRELVAQGYAISTFSEPLQNEEFDVDSYAEMLSEWGWTSNEKQKPSWMY